VEGKTLENCEGSLELIVGYGRTLGLLHQNLKAYPEPESRSDHKAFLLQIRDRFVAYHAPKELMKEWESVDKTLEALPIRRDIYGVVHYDFEPDNVMFCEETGAFGVIDFDDAIQCWYALDIVRALDALEDVSSEDDQEERERAFLQGYREKCTLSEEQMETIPLMRRLVTLADYSTILHVLSETVEEEPDWMTEIILRLKHRLQMIEQSIQ